MTNYHCKHDGLIGTQKLTESSEWPIYGNVETQTNRDLLFEGLRFACVCAQASLVELHTRAIVF
jgi:hypothetical protein